MDAVGRRHKIKKVASNRYSPVDDSSFIITPDENAWIDFGKHKRGGGIFEYEMLALGCTFEEAVTSIAQFAGIPLPNSGANRSRPQTKPAEKPAPQQQQQHRSKWGDPVALFPFEDADGAERYHVARFEWIEGGKRHKATPPRRAAPGEPGKWVWGLKADDYVRSPRNGDWYQATDERRRQWPQAEIAHFEEEAPLLYRLPELLEELSQPREDQRVIFNVEGERKVDLLRSWGCVATTNMGGVNGWLPHFPEYFGGADVVIMPDNDDAGRRFAHAKAASLRDVARRVRILDLRLFWPGCPQKGDVVDWARIGGGNQAALFEIVEKLPDWTPEVPKSEFNALRFSDLDQPRRHLEWLVKQILQRGEMSIWYGDFGTGKSFLLTDCSFAIARGVEWFGRRTRPGLVVYQAGEGEIGFGNRMDAYRRHNQVDYAVPFVALCSRVNLFTTEKGVDALIAEINAWSMFYGMPAELLVIDTFSAASSGADENLGRDVGLVLERARRISRETKAHVAIVHHVPKSGSGPRGWSGFLGNVDSAVLVENTDEQEEDNRDGRSISRVIHKFTVTKQKDAASHFSRMFTLPQVVLGRDPDGDDITSCVVRQLETTQEAAARRSCPDGWAILHQQNEDVFRALVRALKEHGVLLPAATKAPRDALCCTVQQWQAELIALKTGFEEITPHLRHVVSQRVQRALRRWLPDQQGLIVKDGQWVWRTNRRVFKIDREPRGIDPMEIEQQKPLLAPGETENELPFDL
jgi:hypothetical protein